jgi:hypothetical protein
MTEKQHKAGNGNENNIDRKNIAIAKNKRYPIVMMIIE